MFILENFKVKEMKMCVNKEKIMVDIIFGFEQDSSVALNRSDEGISVGTKASCCPVWDLQPK